MTGNSKMAFPSLYLNHFVPHIRGNVIQRAGVHAIWRDISAFERDARNGARSDYGSLSIVGEPLCASTFR